MGNTSSNSNSKSNSKESIKNQIQELTKAGTIKGQKTNGSGFDGKAITRVTHSVGSDTYGMSGDDTITTIIDLDFSKGKNVEGQGAVTSLGGVISGKIKTKNGVTTGKENAYFFKWDKKINGKFPVGDGQYTYQMYDQCLVARSAQNFLLE